MVEPHSNEHWLVDPWLQWDEEGSPGMMGFGNSDCSTMRDDTKQPNSYTACDLHGQALRHRCVSCNLFHISYISLNLY